MTLKVLQSFRLKSALSGRMNMYLFKLMDYVQGGGVDYLCQFFELNSAEHEIFSANKYPVRLSKSLLQRIYLAIFFLFLLFICFKIFFLHIFASVNAGSVLFVMSQTLFLFEEFTKGDSNMY